MELLEITYKTMVRMNKYKGRIGKQFKSFTIETKELNINSESRIISGYAAVFNNIDKAGDLLIKGCFSKSIQERGPESQANDKIIMLWMHDMKEPIGKITKLYEDEKGLYFEAEIDDVPKGNQAIQQLKSGTLNQFSIGYKYVCEKCEWDDERDCLVVKEVVLYELSVVSIGCNGETQYLGLKSIDDYDNAYADLQKQIDAVCKGLPLLTQQCIQELISKSISLAVCKPEEKPLAKKEADNKESEKDFFKTIKLRQDE